MFSDDFQNYTPLYRALQEQRYLRRRFLNEIKKAFRVSGVLAYISLGESIDDFDPIAFEDLLYDYGRRKLYSIVLILHSHGGSADVAEKLVDTIRDKVRKFYVIVPEKAKSAATLLSLGSDKIYMLEGAELGPIDPQIKLPDGNWIPAQSIIDGYITMLQLASTIEDEDIKALLLQKINPELLDFSEKTKRHAQVIAEKLLANYMLKYNKQKAKEVAEKLSDVEEFLSHGRPIRWIDAQKIGLIVEPVKRGMKKYELVWRYFTHALVFMSKGGLQKLFENDNKVSLVF